MPQRSPRHPTEITKRDWSTCATASAQIHRRKSAVVLDAGLLPRRAYAAGLIGQALVAAALGSGHRRIARELAVPAGTVRGWIRGARRSAARLRITGIRTVVAFDQDALPTRVRPDELGGAPEHLGAAASVLGRRFGLQHTSP
jgi:hypothetical protein